MEVVLYMSYKQVGVFQWITADAAWDHDANTDVTYPTSKVSLPPEPCAW